MIHDHSTASAEPSVADAAWFPRSATMITRGAVLLGGLRAVRSLLAFMSSPAPGLAATLGAVVGACSEVVVYGLVGLAASAVVRALGAWATSRAPAARIHPPEVPGSIAAPSPTTTEVASRPVAADRLAEVRRLIRDHEWDAATAVVRAFRDEHPADPGSASASDELERAMRAALGRLEAELQAARDVNDPDQVLEIHGRMGPLLDDDRRKSLDVDLSRWFLGVVHRRLRSGRIQADVVELAGRIAEGFGHTTDGASLRASMPTLRRSAGLCPRCGKPYTGAAQACPECLRPAPAPPPAPEPDEPDEPAVGSREPALFVDPFDEPPG